MKVGFLYASKVSKQSCTQRGGRAGRCGPGWVINILPRWIHDKLEECVRPETKYINCSRLIIELKCNGIDPTILLPNMLDPPPPNRVSLGMEELKDLNMIEPNGQPTDLGHVCNDLRTEPKVCVALLYFVFKGLIRPGALLVHLLNSPESNLFYTKPAEKDKGGGKGSPPSDSKGKGKGKGTAVDEVIEGKALVAEDDKKMGSDEYGKLRHCLIMIGIPEEWAQKAYCKRHGLRYFSVQKIISEARERFAAPFLDLIDALIGHKVGLGSDSIPDSFDVSNLPGAFNVMRAFLPLLGERYGCAPSFHSPGNQLNTQGTYGYTQISDSGSIRYKVTSGVRKFLLTKWGDRRARSITEIDPLFCAVASPKFIYWMDRVRTDSALVLGVTHDVASCLSIIGNGLFSAIGQAASLHRRITEGRRIQDVDVCDIRVIQHWMRLLCREFYHFEPEVGLTLSNFDIESFRKENVDNFNSDRSCEVPDTMDVEHEIYKKDFRSCFGSLESVKNSPECLDKICYDVENGNPEILNSYSQRGLGYGVLSWNSSLASLYFDRGFFQICEYSSSL